MEKESRTKQKEVRCISGDNARNTNYNRNNLIKKSISQNTIKKIINKNIMEEFIELEVKKNSDNEVIVVNKNTAYTDKDTDAGSRGESPEQYFDESLKLKKIKKGEKFANHYLKINTNKTTLFLLLQDYKLVEQKLKLFLKMIMIRRWNMRN